jgi:beta-glucosidase/6-phospho-beta-glucosidase/beta-galactosidase
MAPGLTLHGTGTYNTSYTILRSHAAAYRLYAERYRSSQFGRVGISLNCDWAHPVGDSPLNHDAANRFLQWYIGIWAHPILQGDYPEIIKEKVKEKTQAKGFRKSRLPELTQEEIEYIRGTYDFIGLNSYTTRMVEHKLCSGEEGESFYCHYFKKNCI